MPREPLSEQEVIFWKRAGLNVLNETTKPKTNAAEKLKKSAEKESQETEAERLEAISYRLAGIKVLRG